jgi:hypothetical protein
MSRMLYPSQKTPDHPRKVSLCMPRDSHVYQILAPFRLYAHSSHRRAKIFRPSLMSHVILDSLPNGFNNFSISPSSCAACRRIPFLQSRSKDTPTPSSDGIWQLFASPSHIDAHSIPEQFRRLLPLITLELPHLASCEDSNHARPVFWLELLGCIHDDEPNRTVRVNGWQDTRYV